MSKTKLPPREIVGQTICPHRHCSATATVKRDAGGFLFLSCPECGTVNNRRPSYQAALSHGMAAYSASQDKQPAALDQAQQDTPPANMPPPRRGLFGGLAIIHE